VDTYCNLCNTALISCLFATAIHIQPICRMHLVHPSYDLIVKVAYLFEPNDASSWGMNAVASVSPSTMRHKWITTVNAFLYKWPVHKHHFAIFANLSTLLYITQAWLFEKMIFFPLSVLADESCLYVMTMLFTPIVALPPCIEFPVLECYIHIYYAFCPPWWYALDMYVHSCYGCTSWAKFL